METNAFEISARGDMPTEWAIAWAQGVMQLAELLGITHSAVSQWGPTAPKRRQYELREKRPRWFKDGVLKPPPAAAESTPLPEADSGAELVAKLEQEIENRVVLLSRLKSEVNRVAVQADLDALRVQLRTAQTA